MNYEFAIAQYKILNKKGIDDLNCLIKLIEAECVKYNDNTLFLDKILSSEKLSEKTKSIAISVKKIITSKYGRVTDKQRYAIAKDFLENYSLEQFFFLFCEGDYISSEKRFKTVEINEVKSLLAA